MHFNRLCLFVLYSMIHFVGIGQTNYKSLVNAATESTKNQDYNAAIQFLLKAKDLKGKDQAYSDRIYMHLGSNYEALNQIDSSIFYYGEAVKFGEDQKDYAALSFLFNRLGSIELSYTGRYSNAIKYFKRQLSYDNLLKDSTSVFDVLNNIGLAFKGMNNLDSAIVYFKKVTNNHSLHNGARNNALLFTGDIYSLQKKYKNALTNYDEAILGLTLENDSMGLYAAYANKGDCLMQQHDFEESLISLEKASQFITSDIQNNHKATLYHNFAYVYQNLKNFEKAFYYKNLESTTKDNINIESIGNAVAEMSAKYELRQKQDSLFINKQNLVLAHAKASEKERNFIILLLASIALLIIFINIYRIRRLRFKNTLQRQEAEQKTLKLTHQYQLSESELKAIRSQMNPHFIFNVLNSIESYIMDNDKRTASRLVQKFASLSRLILENSTKSLVTADKEWKALMLYTELEAMRYNNAFTYDFIVDESLELRTLLLPPMLVQPLIENAILHGLIVDKHPDAHLAVSINRKEDEIIITVKDNGVGIGNAINKKAKDGIKEMSIGLTSIQERIDMININQTEKKASFTLEPNANHRGTTAIICLPLLYANS